MKMLSKIAILFSVLTLLMFGTMGIGVEKCSCTGKTTLMIPIDDDCCPAESDCMTITVAHISDYVVQHHNDTPQPTAIAIWQEYNNPYCWAGRLCTMHETSVPDNAPPPKDHVGSVVIRV